MKYLSLCSGIEAASVAWEPLGWKAVGFSEIESFPSAVLAHHYPSVPNLGDMTQYENWKIKPKEIDLLVGGTPCQSFSVAGLRKGLADPRGNLALVYCGIAEKLKPRWIVWENVPGVLSSSEGRDFGSFLGALGEIGYGYAYRVLDAQFCRTHRHPRAVPQRRRRVFLIGYLGDWRPAASVLFEQQSVRGNPTPSRTTRKDASTKTGTSTTISTEPVNEPFTIAFNDVNGTRKDRPNGGMYINPADISGAITQVESDTKVLAFRKSRRAKSTTDHETWVSAESSNCLNAFDVGDIRDTHAIVGALCARDFKGVGSQYVQEGKCIVENRSRPIAIQGNLIGRVEGGPQGVGASDDGVMYTLTKGDVHAVANPTPPVMAFQSSELRLRGTLTNHEISPTLKAETKCGDTELRIQQEMAVRRLTPTECERLQGFPDGWTYIPWRGKPGTPDGLRYKALGNSMAVNCMEWIGERIQSAETKLKGKHNV